MCDGEVESVTARRCEHGSVFSQWLIKKLYQPNRAQRVKPSGSCAILLKFDVNARLDKVLIPPPSSVRVSVNNGVKWMLRKTPPALQERTD